MKTFLTAAVSLGLFASLVTACKTGTTTSSTAGSGQFRNPTQQGGMASLSDVQEFYEIAKTFYLNRAKTQNFEQGSRFEAEFFSKFGVPMNSNEAIYDFSNTLFELMESGNFSVTLHGIPRKMRTSAMPPKGMSSRDLADFLQLVKTEYFKYIAGVKMQNFPVRDINFYARMQGLPPNAMPRQGDLLIIAGDLFEKIETGR